MRLWWFVEAWRGLRLLILPVVLSIHCKVRLVMEYCPAGTVLDFVRAAGKVRCQSSEYVMLCGLPCQLRDLEKIQREVQRGQSNHS